MLSDTELNRLVARTVMASFSGPDLPAWAGHRLEAGLGGICLFGENVRTVKSTTALVAAIHQAGGSALVTLDEEGGDVTRLFADRGSPHAGHAVLGRADDEALTGAVATEVGSLLREVGVDINLGPVADVNSNPSNPVIGVRSFGADPALVARHVVAWVRGLQESGVGACLKHFPGHGDTVADSHVSLPTVSAPPELLRRRELVPFASGLAAGALSVMTSHVVIRAVDPGRPATFSPAATALLRDDPARGGMGFDGLLISDALDMQGASGEIGVPAAAVRALAAGVDLLCLGPNFQDDQVQAVLTALTAAVRSGELPEKRLVEATGRVERAVEQVAGMRAGVTRLPAGSGIAGSASGEAARRALEVDGPLEPLTGAQVVRFTVGASVAAGRVPWGLPADGRVLAGNEVLDLEEGSPEPRLDPNRPVVALVRGAHRFPWVTDALSRLAAQRPDLVVVEHGWPGPDRLPGRTVVTTVGASAVTASALDRLLAGSDRIDPPTGEVAKES